MILIFSNSTSQHIGGLEIFNEELENLLDFNNIEYFRSSSIISLKIIDYASRIINSLIYTLKNYKKIDFILVQHGNFFDILSLPLLKLSFKPIRIISHVGDTWKHVSNNKLLALTNFILRKNAQKIYIISDEQRSFLNHGNIKKIHTILNTKYFEMEKIEQKDNMYLLYLGRICPEKGVEDLITVFSELKNVINLPKLKIVGPIEDAYKQQLDKLLVEYKINDQVRIFDPIYDIDRKIELIDNATILVYPSYSDAFPLTVIEAFARGTCCLASSISETKNFIEFDDFLFTPGNLIDLKNKLHTLLLNQNLFDQKISFMKNKSRIYTKGEIFNEIFIEQ